MSVPSHPSIDLVQRLALVRGDVFRLVAPDLVLRFVLTGVVRVSLVIEIFRVNLDDPAAHVTRLRIPADVIADPESFAHDGAPARADCSSRAAIVLSNATSARSPSRSLWITATASFWPPRL